MKTTIDFLDAVKARNNGASDYAVAKMLGVTQQTVSRWRVGKDFFGDSAAIKVADKLKIDPRYVVACAHAERAKGDDEKAVWLGIAGLFQKTEDGKFCIMLSPKLADIFKTTAFHIEPRLLTVS